MDDPLFQFVLTDFSEDANVCTRRSPTDEQALQCIHLAAARDRKDCDLRAELERATFTTYCNSLYGADATPYVPSPNLQEDRLNGCVAAAKLLVNTDYAECDLFRR